MRFVVTVKGRVHLAKVLRRVRRLNEEITKILTPVAKPFVPDPARKPHVVLVVGARFDWTLRFGQEISPQARVDTAAVVGALAFCGMLVAARGLGLRQAWGYLRTLD